MVTHKLIDELERDIRESNAEKVQAGLVAIYEEVMGGDMELINSIVEPRVISSLHQRLNERLGVPPRAMMLKTRVPLRKQRALMFVKAMQNGVRRTLESK